MGRWVRGRFLDGFCLAMLVSILVAALSGQVWDTE